MPRLGVRDGEPLDLQEPCGLPRWFGQNLDAWNDALGTGGISQVLDAHPYLVIRVLRQGLFAPGNADGLGFAEVTALTGRGLVELQE